MSSGGCLNFLDTHNMSTMQSAICISRPLKECKRDQLKLLILLIIHYHLILHTCILDAFQGFQMIGNLMWCRMLDDFITDDNI